MYSLAFHQLDHPTVLMADGSTYALEHDDQDEGRLYLMRTTAYDYEQYFRVHERMEHVEATIEVL